MCKTTHTLTTNIAFEGKILATKGEAVRIIEDGPVPIVETADGRVSFPVDHNEIAAWPVLAPALAEKRAHLISLGFIDPACAQCAELMTNPNAFCPDHKASSGCESGSRSHCTCDACF